MEENMERKDVFTENDITYICVNANKEIKKSDYRLKYYDLKSECNKEVSSRKKIIRQEYLLGKKIEYLILLDDDIPIGYIDFILREIGKNVFAVYLSMIYIKNEYRRFGFGYVVLRNFIYSVSANTTFYWYVKRNDKPTMLFFDKCVLDFGLNAIDDVRIDKPDKFNTNNYDLYSFRRLN